MKIAVTSQNRKIVTGHAGKCRKFWIYEAAGGVISGKTLLELPLEQSFHASHGGPHPLDDVDVLICGGMGQGLVNRLQAMGIEGLVTTETDPDHAVASYLAGSLPLGMPESHSGHEHHHGHHRHDEVVFITAADIPTRT
jgi:predicted Fe-Mo cluster-binding NifX family protein